MPVAAPIKPLLSAENLSVTYVLPSGRAARAVREVTFEIQPGECLGVLGESGSGKTTTARAIPGLLPQSARVTGSIRFADRDLIGLSEREARRIRGAQIALVPQDPDRALHPMLRSREQVAAVLRAHRPSPERQSQREAERILERMFGADWPAIACAYPHELSGGQRQRLAFAQATACNPCFVIADEPTASLDAVTESRIVGLLLAWKQTTSGTLLLISHNPRVLLQLADRIVVFYAGQIIETGPAAQVLASPLHPYTRALLRSAPEIGSSGRRPRLSAVPGDAPDPCEHVWGCAFRPRCSEASAPCAASTPALLHADVARQVRCLNAA